MIYQDTIIHAASASGSDVTAAEIASWTYTKDADKFQANWSVAFRSPRVIQGDELITIGRRIRTAGSDVNVTLIEDGPLISWDSAFSESDLATSASGYDYTENDPTLAVVEQDTYFVNPSWLNKMAGGKKSWVVRHGVLYWAKTTWNGKQKLRRIQHADLPDVNKPIGADRVYVSYVKHWDVLNFIAQEISRKTGILVKLLVNTPNLIINHSHILRSGSSFVEAINGLVSLWNPFVRFLKDPVEENTYTLLILDPVTQDQDKPQPRTIRIGKKAISPQGISYKDQWTNLNDIVDKVIIKGGAVSQSVELPDPGQLKVTILDPLELDPKNFLQFYHVENVKSILEQKTKGDYKEGFNEPDPPPQKRPETIHKYETYYQVPDDPTKILLMAQRTETYHEDTLIHSMDVFNVYSDKGYQIIRTKEEESALINEPGKPYKVFRWVLRRVVNQSRIYDGLQRANSIEMTEEPVVVTKVYPKNGEPYYAGPVRLIQAQNQNMVIKDASTTQEIIEMTTKIKTTKLHRVTKNVLRCEELEWDNLSETQQCNTQTIADPRVHQQDPDPRYHEEFSRPGVTTFHKSVTIEHPDIVDHTTAQMVADRAFARSSTIRKELSIGLQCPIPINENVYNIAIPQMDIYVTTAAGRELRLFPGGTFIQTRLEERESIGLDGKLSSEQTVACRNVL